MEIPQRRTRQPAPGHRFRLFHLRGGLQYHHRFAGAGNGDLAQGWIWGRAEDPDRQLGPREQNL